MECYESLLIATYLKSLGILENIFIRLHIDAHNSLILDDGWRVNLR